LISLHCCVFAMADYAWEEEPDWVEEAFEKLQKATREFLKALEKEQKQPENKNKYSEFKYLKAVLNMSLVAMRNLEKESRSDHKALQKWLPGKLDEIKALLSKKSKKIKKKIKKVKITKVMKKEKKKLMKS